jgi:hypothetical protein
VSVTEVCERPQYLQWKRNLLIRIRDLHHSYARTKNCSLRLGATSTFFAKNCLTCFTKEPPSKNHSSPSSAAEKIDSGLRDLGGIFYFKREPARIFGLTLIERTLDEGDLSSTVEKQNGGGACAIPASIDKNWGEHPLTFLPESSIGQLIVRGRPSIVQKVEQRRSREGFPLEPCLETPLGSLDLGPRGIESIVAETMKAGLNGMDTPLTIGVVIE